MKRGIISALVIILLSMLLQGCLQQAALPEGDTAEASSVVAKAYEAPEPKFIEVSIAAVGDIMVHGPQLRAQFNLASNSYDFTNNFKYVEKYLKASDIAIGNLETTFGGAERGYSSFPMFNTPDELAAALRKAGFRVLSTANNHALDTGKNGLIRTLEVLRENHLIPIGTRASLDEKGYYVSNVKGISIGFTAYTFETPRQGEYKALNALKIPKDTEALIDTFSYEYLEEDLAKIKDRINLIKEEGAELVVVSIHWGNEYRRASNDYQKRIAEALADFGADIIFGSHPHVLQPIQLIQSKHRSEPTLVCYSLGNFLSNQRYEIISNRYTEDGLIVNVKVKKDLSDNSVSISQVEYAPTWIHRFNKDGKVIYEILPLLDALENEAFYELTSTDSRWRAQNSLSNTQSIIDLSYGKIVPYRLLNEIETEVLQY